VTAAQTSDPTDGRPRAARAALRLDHQDRVSRRARRLINDHCSGRVPDEIIADAQLVASELVTNAFEHSGDGIVTIDVFLETEALVLTVISPSGARPVPSPDRWRLPTDAQRTGRGLALAGLVASGATVDTGTTPDGDGGWSAITVRLPRSRWAA
jgi:anti-sigma regulatory factor (Ser/Thr protein kinase)